MRNRVLPTLLALVFLAGCNKGGKQALPELYPVKGVVKRDGQLVSGGSITFTPESGKSDVLINSEVGADGAYSLSTVAAEGKNAERKPGAPAGTYKVTYNPPQEQRAGVQTDPISIPGTVTVKTGENDIPINLPKK